MPTGKEGGGGKSPLQQRRKGTFLSFATNATPGNGRWVGKRRGIASANLQDEKKEKNSNRLRPKKNFVCILVSL